MGRRLSDPLTETEIETDELTRWGIIVIDVNLAMGQRGVSAVKVKELKSLFGVIVLFGQ